MGAWTASVLRLLVRVMMGPDAVQLPLHRVSSSPLCCSPGVRAQEAVCGRVPEADGGALRMCPLHRQPGQGIGGRGAARGQEQVWQLRAAPQEAPGKPGPRPNRKLPLSSQYADPVTDLLDRCGVFRARLFRESCVFHQGCYVKDLSRLGRDLRKTLILDNSPASYIFHPENAVSGPYTHAAGLGGALSWVGGRRGGRAVGAAGAPQQPA